MSFFYDFVKEMKISDLETETLMSFILDKGFRVIGKIKVMLLEENKIIVKSHKKQITIYGENLEMNTIAKGEIIVSGKVFKIEVGEWYGKCCLCKGFWIKLAEIDK